MPITEYCDKSNLSTSDRLQLFAIVCHAVQHAHQKGVIHRDLKPANIMVTLHDGTAVPKVIDFGVSKAISQRLTEKTLFTTYGQMIGTPQYMSPEQSEMSGLDVDTRSDVYSLGVILYELLTGLTPIEAERLRIAGFAEMQRIIREEDPLKPSVRLSSLGEQVTVIAKHRNTDPKRLRQTIQGDLDWIVMKSLEKERVRRYASPASLADDIGRFLANDAVEACPPSIAYKVNKFVLKHRMIVTVVVTIVLILAASTVISSFFAHRSFHHAKREEIARVASEKAAEAEKLAREQVEKEVERNRRLRYIADMNVAMQAWEESNIGRVVQILQEYAITDGRTDLRGFEWLHLWHHVQRSLQTPRLNDDRKVRTLAFSPSGNTLAVTYHHGTVTLFDVLSRNPIDSFGESRTPFYSFVAYSPDGVRLAFPSPNPNEFVIRVLSTGEEQRINGHQSTVNAVVFSPNGQCLASASADKTVKIWDMSGQLLRTLPGHESGVRSLAFSPDGQLLASGDDMNNVRLWNSATGRLSADIGQSVISYSSARPSVCRRVWSLAFSSDGTMLAAACGDGMVRLHDLTSERVYDLPGHRDEVRFVAFSNDHKTLASGSRDSTVKLWDIASRQEKETLKGNSFASPPVAFCPNQELLAAGNALWPLSSQETSSLPQFGGTVEDICALSDGETFVFVAGERDPVTNAQSETDQDENLLEKKALVWNSTNDEKAWSVPVGEQIQSSAISRSGLLAIGGTTTLQLWDAFQRQQVSSVSLARGAGLSCLALNQEGTKVIAGYRNGEIIVRDTKTLQPLLEMHGHSEQIMCLAICNQGEKVASVDSDGKTILWQMDNGAQVSVFSRKGRAAKCMAFSPDDSVLAIGGGGGLELWDLGQVEHGPRTLMMSRSANSIEFSKDGQSLFAAHADLVVRIWDVATGKQKLRLAGHTSPPHALALSPDGRTLYSGDRYGTVKAWRAATLKEVQDADPTLMDVFVP